MKLLFIWHKYFITLLMLFIIQKQSLAIILDVLSGEVIHRAAKEYSMGDCIAKTAPFLRKFNITEKLLADQNALTKMLYSSRIKLSLNCQQCLIDIQEGWVDYFVKNYSEYNSKAIDYFSAEKYHYTFDSKERPNKFAASGLKIKIDYTHNNHIFLTGNELSDIPFAIKYKYRKMNRIRNFDIFTLKEIPLEENSTELYLNLIYGKSENAYISMAYFPKANRINVSLEKINYQGNDQMVSDVQRVSDDTTTKRIFFDAFLKKLQQMDLSVQGTAYQVNMMIRQAALSLVANDKLLSDINDFVFFNAVEKDVFMRSSFLALYNMIMQYDYQKLMIASSRFYKFTNIKIKVNQKMDTRARDNIFSLYIDQIKLMTSRSFLHIDEQIVLLVKYLKKDTHYKNLSTDVVTERFIFMYKIFTMLDLSKARKLNDVPPEFLDFLIQYLKENPKLVDTHTFSEFTSGRPWLADYLDEQLMKL